MAFVDFVILGIEVYTHDVCSFEESKYIGRTHWDGRI